MRFQPVQKMLKRQVAGITCALAMACLCAPAFADNDPKQLLAAKAVVLHELPRASADRGSQEQLRAGIAMIRKETGQDTPIIPAETTDELASAAANAAEQGAELVVFFRPSSLPELLELVQRYPRTRFSFIDADIPTLYPHVQSIAFNDDEGAFLAGMIAAFTSRQNRVAFLSLERIPLSRHFAFAYLQGAKFAVSTMKVDSRILPASEEDAVSTHMKRFYEEGADVVFSVADGHTAEAVQTARQQHRYIITLDPSQEAMHPGVVLTSIIRRGDLALADVLRDYYQQKWQPGAKKLGISEGYIDYTIGKYNKSVLGKDTVDKVEAAKDLLMRGVVEIKPYGR